MEFRGGEKRVTLDNCNTAVGKFGSLFGDIDKEALSFLKYLVRGKQ